MKNEKLQLKIKTWGLVFPAVIVAFGILAISVIRVSALTQSQNYKITPVEKSSSEKVATPTAQKNVDYFLAYPGLLPDHPLYFLKMIRDRVWLSLTFNPLRKAELLLLFADKRLGAGKVLIEGNKAELGLSTLTKAEKYLERAINQERIAAQKGEQTDAFLKKLFLAIQKHEEVIVELQERFKGDAKGMMGDLLNYPRQGYEQIKERLGEK